MKKSVLLLAGVAMAFSLAGCKEKKTASGEPGKVLNIAVWNEEFMDRFKTYVEAAGLIPEGVEVKFHITPSTDNAYQNRLDEMLLGQKKAKADEKIDLFLVESDYALKYVDTPYTLDVIKDIGLTKDDLKDQYKYTKDIMTDSKGNLKGVTWQACPGGFVYRRSIAKDVLGTDDPVEVQKHLANWAKFDTTAAKAKEKGYFMLSGFDDAYRVFSDNIKTPVVKDNIIQVDPQIKMWVAQTKRYTDLGYNNKANLWSSESFQGAAKNGKVFGYFGPAWFIDFCLAPATLDDPNLPKELGNGSYGDWAFCNGPQGFSWGGSWICAASGSDNIELIKTIMLKLTCDEKTMIQIAMEKSDFTNNIPAMMNVASSTYQNAFLGGQNHIAFFIENARSIDKSTISAYDQGYAEKLQSAFSDYFNGLVSEEKAWDNFFTSLIEKYPNLQRE